MSRFMLRVAVQNATPLLAQMIVVESVAYSSNVTLMSEWLRWLSTSRGQKRCRSQGCQAESHKRSWTGWGRAKDKIGERFSL